MSRRVRHPLAWLGVGVGVAVVVAVVALTAVTRSDRGRGVILGYTLQALGGQLNGQLVVERLDGDILTGARLYGIAVRETNGDPLLLADSAFIEYDVPTFLGGDIVINRLVLYDADLMLRRLPGDSLWNYQKILQDTSAAPTEGAGRATLIQRLEMVAGRATVLLPWEPVARSGPARDLEIRGALADTSRLVVDSVPEGLVRTMRFEVDTAVVADLTIAPAERGGISLAVAGADARVYLWSDPPLHLAGLQGDLTVREGVVRYRAPSIALPGSRIQSAGVVDLTQEEPRYDLVVEGEGIDLADLQWLLPSLPDQGSVTSRLWLESRPEGLLFLARGLRLQAPDTRVAGDFGMIVGDTLRFVEAELRAEPLDLRSFRDLLPPSVPVAELRIGALAVESPTS